MNVSPIRTKQLFPKAESQSKALECYKKALVVGMAQKPAPHGNGLQKHMQTWVKQRLSAKSCLPHTLKGLL